MLAAASFYRLAEKLVSVFIGEAFMGMFFPRARLLTFWELLEIMLTLALLFASYANSSFLANSVLEKNCALLSMNYRLLSIGCSGFSKSKSSLMSITLG